jgi:hypothetical protein
MERLTQVYRGKNDELLNLAADSGDLAEVAPPNRRWKASIRSIGGAVKHVGSGELKRKQS